MNIVTKIITSLLTVLGAIAAIKTLVPEQITYLEIITNFIFYSGWAFSFILVLVLIYQEAKNKDSINALSNANSKIQEECDNKLRLIEDMTSEKILTLTKDKEFFKISLTNNDKVLGYFASTLSAPQKPIPKEKGREEEDEF